MNRFVLFVVCILMAALGFFEGSTAPNQTAAMIWGAASGIWISNAINLFLQWVSYGNTFRD